MSSYLYWGGVVRLIDWIYPIGSVITSVNPSYDPNKIFKTHTWVRFAAGRTLVGYNAAEVEFNAIEKVGGEKTHTLTTAEMPSHTHQIARYVNAAAGSARWSPVAASGYDLTVTTATGGSGAHNNLQPYITVYFWKRTA